MIGQTISHYKITARLGVGGMGEVYLATDLSLDRPVALKFLPESLSKDPESRERLIREAKAASRLNHPNILTVYAVEQAEGRDFIVMEYVEGKTLKELAAGGGLPIPRALDLAIQIGDGLHAAHEQGIVHRDVKSENILVTPKNQAKIMDFGLAKVKGSPQLTQVGTTIGTLSYMSPEQAQGLEADHRSDIFSFGVVVYELLTGRLPFAGEHEAAILYSIVNEEHPPLARANPKVSLELERTVAKALSKDVDGRYQHADDMVVDLRRERKQLEYAKSGMIQTAAVVRKPRRGYLKYVAATTAVFVIALVLLILKPFKVEVVREQKATAAENSLAVMYFDNLADPDDTDKTAQMITSLLITGLSESQYLEVVSRQRLYDILNLLGKQGVKAIDRSTASQVAEKAGVKWILTGDILQTQPKIVLTAEVSEAASGRLVTTQRVSGDTGEDLFAVVDKLGAAIRNHLALPEAAQSEPTRSVAEVTTHSPEAYRYYLEGLDYNYKLYAAEARQSLEKALSYDSTFAMAYYQLSNTNVGVPPGPKERNWIAQAVKYADKASWKEQRYIKAGAASLAADRATTIAELRQIIDRYPNEKEAYMALGYAYQGEEWGKALPEFERVIAIDPLDKIAYNSLAYAYDWVGNFEKSLWAINQYIALAPDEANPYDSRADLYAFNGRLDEAIESYKKAVQIKPDFPSVGKLGFMYLFKRDYTRAESTFQAMAASPNQDIRSQGRGLMALVPSYQGRLAKALEVVNEGISADRMERYEGQGYLDKLESVVYLYHEQGNLEAALTELARVQSFLLKMNPDDFPNRRSWEVEILSEKKDFVRAREVADALRRDIEKRDSTLMNQYWYAAGCIAMSEDRLTEAIPLLEKAEAVDKWFRARCMLGRVYLQNGNLDKAVSILEKALARYDENRAFDPVVSVRCHYLLGLAYEQSGWKDKAVEQYRTFLDIWKDADPGFKEIDDAKARLAQLTS